MIKPIGLLKPDPSMNLALDVIRKDSDMKELFRLAAKYGRTVTPIFVLPVSEDT